MPAAAQSSGYALADARWGLRLTKWSSRLANCAAGLCLGLVPG